MEHQQGFGLTKPWSTSLQNGTDMRNSPTSLRVAHFDLRNQGNRQVAPLSMFEEANTKTNLPAQIDMLSQSSASDDLDDLHPL